MKQEVSQFLSETADLQEEKLQHWQKKVDREGRSDRTGSSAPPCRDLQVTPDLHRVPSQQGAGLSQSARWWNTGEPGRWRRRLIGSQRCVYTIVVVIFSGTFQVIVRILVFISSYKTNGTFCEFYFLSVTFWTHWEQLSTRPFGSVFIGNIRLGRDLVPVQGVKGGVWTLEEEEEGL